MHQPSNLSTLSDETYLQAVTELTFKDADLAGVVEKWGIPPFWVHAPGFPGMVAAVLAQQVSLESAQATLTKLEKAIDSITPEDFLSLKSDTLRKIGFSRQKASYVHRIARGIMTGTIDFADLSSMNGNAARKFLMELRGVGPWTADTYLLFSLRRPDVWPSGDLALIKAVSALKKLSPSARSEEVNQIADNWKPLRSVAARILWHYYLCERGRRVSA